MRRRGSRLAMALLWLGLPTLGLGCQPPPLTSIVAVTQGDPHGPAYQERLECAASAHGWVCLRQVTSESTPPFRRLPVDARDALLVRLSEVDARSLPDVMQGGTHAAIVQVTLRWEGGSHRFTLAQGVTPPAEPRPQDRVLVALRAAVEAALAGR